MKGRKNAEKHTCSLVHCFWSWQNNQLPRNSIAWKNACLLWLSITQAVSITYSEGLAGGKISLNTHTFSIDVSLKLNAQKVTGLGYIESSAVLEKF